MLAEIPTEEYSAALDRCAADTLWEAAADQPPVDAVRLAERLGIVVTRDDRLAERARIVRLSSHRVGCGETAIVVGAEPRAERRHWAIAHEIGEAIAHRVFVTLGVDPLEAPALSREHVANSLAGRLLLPRKWFMGLYRDTEGDLLAIKRVFTTASHELIARRVLECVREPLIVTVYDHGAIAWRRWNLSGPAPPPLRLEAETQRAAHASGQPAWGDGHDEPFTATGGPPLQRVRCWPVHEPGWRREIVFAELRPQEDEWF